MRAESQPRASTLDWHRGCCWEQPQHTALPGQPCRLHHQLRPRHAATVRPGMESPLSCCRHTHATGATQHPPPAACRGREVPGRYLGDGLFIRQVLEDWSIVITVLHDDREVSGDLPGVREGVEWVWEMCPAELGTVLAPHTHSDSKASQHHPPLGKPTSSPLPHQASSMALLRSFFPPHPQHPPQPPSPCSSTHYIVLPVVHLSSDAEPGPELGGHKAGFGQGLDS